MRPAAWSVGFAEFHASRTLAADESSFSAARTSGGNEYRSSPRSDAATERPSAPASAEASCVSPEEAASSSMPLAEARSAAVSARAGCVA
eukprot:374267-Prymnesium_polylepis.1